MPKRKAIKKSLRKPTKYEKITRKRKLLYKCTAKSENVKYVTFQEPNKHGAFNNIIKVVPYYTLSFMFSFDVNKILDVKQNSPDVLFAQFTIETKLKEVYDRFEINQLYKELPVSV